MHLPSTIQAVIFDLDGTIVDSEPLHEQTFYQLFAELGHPEDHGIEFSKFYGTSDEAVWIDFLQRFPQPQSLQELLHWKQVRYLETARQVNPVFPGIPELISLLANQFKLGLASGSRHDVIDAMLDLSQLGHHFPHTIRTSSQDVAVGKPEPDIFLLAAARLGVDPSQCVVIEDSVFGVTAAQRAGMIPIAITNTFPEHQLAHAWRVVNSCGELHTVFFPESISRTV